MERFIDRFFSGVNSISVIETPEVNDPVVKNYKAIVSSFISSFNEARTSGFYTESLSSDAKEVMNDIYNIGIEHYLNTAIIRSSRRNNMINTRIQTMVSIIKSKSVSLPRNLNDTTGEYF